MSASFYFYDLETTGVNPREARIMQFAGIRTDMELNPIGEPHNVLIKLSDDVVPEPDAILITGITPQSTIADGITEAEFLKLFHSEVATPGTIFVGYNSVRFDDEFMRYLLYRNFYDPYEWQYTDNKSRWDLLDVVRMTRALRPDGIQWPVDGKGVATNRLELLTKANGISHEDAHDALSDVRAVIEIAKLIKQNQPKLFSFLLAVRDKKAAKKVVDEGRPFLYSSGKYATEFEKTAAVVKLADHPKRQGALVYDLRYDPTLFANLSSAELAEAWRWKKDDPTPRLPIKTLQYNRCPAVAPLSVLDDDSQKRLQITPKLIEENYQKLLKLNIVPQVLQALEVLDKVQQDRYSQEDLEIDARLYDSFIGDADKSASRAVRSAGAEDLASLDITFKDERLTGLLPLYKARNFTKYLSDEERTTWEKHRERKLLGGKQNSRMAKYFARLTELAARADISSRDQYLLEELQLYGQSIMPVDEY
jgi:exodeoxyribonuclease-1